MSNAQFDEDELSMFQDMCSASVENTTNTVHSEQCQHKSVIDDGCRNICEDCGQEIGTDFISYDKEWNNKTNDTRKSQRCTQRKQEPKDIMKDIQEMDIPIDVKIKANELFLEISRDKIFRGDRRKGLIYTCVFKAYDFYPSYSLQKNVTYLQNYFNLDRNVISKTGNLFTQLAHENNVSLKKVHVGAKQYVISLIENLGGTQTDINHIFKIIDLIGTSCHTLNISRPESYASGCVWWFCANCKNQDDIKLFIENSRVKLSAITIDKNRKEVDKRIEELIKTDKESAMFFLSIIKR